MGLQLYYKNYDDEFVPVSTGADLTSPINTTHDGKVGGNESIRLYIKNDDANKWYSTISAELIDTVEPGGWGDIVQTETGWGVKLKKGTEEPTQTQWDSLNWGDPISLDNIGSSGTGDTTTYFPFWYLISCPPNENAKVKSDIFIRISYTENAVS